MNTNYNAKADKAMIHSVTAENIQQYLKGMGFKVQSIKRSTEKNESVINETEKLERNNDY